MSRGLLSSGPNLFCVSGVVYSIIEENFMLALDLHITDPDVGAMKLEDMPSLLVKGMRF